MDLHANAKLGLGGRFALVQAIEGGCSLRAAAERFNFSPATRIVGGTAGAGRARRRGRRSPVCSIARTGRGAVRASCRRRCRRRSVLAVARPAGVRVWSRRRLASPTRPFGRCSGGPGSRVPIVPGEGADEPLRVALPRRSAAHGCEPVRAFRAAGSCRHR